MARRIAPCVVVAALALVACAEQPPEPVLFPRPAAGLPAPAAAAPSGPPAAAIAPADGGVEVQAGDTIFALSRRYNLPVRALIDENRLQPPYVLVVGQRLVLPGGRHHLVQDGETLYGISRLYGVDSFALARANDLRPPFAVVPGQRLLIPAAAETTVAAAPTREAAKPDVAAKPEAAAEVPRPEPAPRRRDSEAASAPSSPADAKAGGERVAQRAAVPQPPPRSGRSFAWPLRGRVLSGYGPKPGGLHNDGINIAARDGETVRAAEDGVVVYAGNELRGFGNLLLIRHADNWVTAYAHNERLLVRRGDTVRRGQAIARAGRSGSVDRPQLHFEIRRGTQAVDPLPHLAGASAPRALAEAAR
jgi:murein DD-endopeptidase MepM/ murein hydrolase activator NlpD